jgi:hypothetical protein
MKINQNNLLRRIKMLEFALLQERKKNGLITLIIYYFSTFYYRKL